MRRVPKHRGHDGFASIRRPRQTSLRLARQPHPRSLPLQRTAYLYVRQSTLRQVVENTESTKRQYVLRQRAVALGWPSERVVIIDCDQGQSAAVADRAGFQQLVTEVGLGRAGIVLGLEVGLDPVSWTGCCSATAPSGARASNAIGVASPRVQ
jgi:hypothetical protein